MEEIKLADFRTITEQLKSMPVDESNGRIFPMVKYKTVNTTIWKLKEKGMQFTTRTRNGNFYVWRIA